MNESHAEVRDDSKPSVNGERRPPIVREIQRVLRERIRAGELASGAKLPSMRQLSGEFACSLGIVKQAVNTLSAQGFLRSSPRRGVYVAPSLPAAREIVLVLPHLEIARLHIGLLGVRRAMEGSGFRVSIHAGDAEPDGNVGTGVPDYLLSSGVAGALVLLPSASEHEALVPTLVAQGLPTAVVDITSRSLGADVVMIDPVETGRMGASHLLGFGHTGLLVVEPVGDARMPADVVLGIESAVGAFGRSCTLRRVAVDGRRDGREPAWHRARDAVMDVLRENGDITGVIGLGPQLTLGACLAARALGRRIPEDLSIVCLLGDSSALQALEPPITIFDNPLGEVCEHAARRLLARIEGLDETPQVIRRPPVLVSRASVARAKGRASS